MTQTTALWRKLGDRFTDNSGNALAGGKLFYYQAGTTTLATTYSDNGGTVANTNPILLDAAGRLDVPVYITTLYNFKELLTDLNGNVISPWPMDNIPAAVAPATSSAGFALPLITWLQYTSAQSPVSVTPSQAGNGFEATTSGGNVGFNLPSASSFGSGKFLWFKKIGAANFVVVNPNGTDQIDGVNQSYLLALNNQALGLVSDGAAWQSVSTAQATPPLPPGGRLTLTTGVPVINADVTGAATVYYTSFVNNFIPIWNGAQFNYMGFASDLSLTLTSSILGSNSIVDVFAINNFGFLTIAAGPAWTNVTAGSCARGTGAATTQLSRQLGVWANAVVITLNNGATAYSNIPVGQATYLGSIFGDGSAGQTSCHVTWGQNRKFGVWNAYNRKPILLKCGDSTATWTYNSSTVRPSNNATANAITSFTGLAEEFALTQFKQAAAESAGTSNASIGIGFNVTNAFTSFAPGIVTGVSGTFAGEMAFGEYAVPPALGINTLTACEKVSAGTTQFSGTELNMMFTCSYLG